MILCEEKNLPHPPAHLLEDLKAQIQRADLVQIPRQAKKFATIPGFLNRTVSWGGNPYVSRVQKRYLISERLTEWACQNLPKGLIDFNVAISEGDVVHGPHVDYNRHYSLLYLIEGNTAAVNSWWQKKGFDIEFYQDSWPSTSSDYHDLVLLEQKKLEPLRWYLLNTWVYHSVENLQGTRISLQGDYNIAF